MTKLADKGIKVRDSLVIDSDIHSSSNHSESSEDESESSPLMKIKTNKTFRLIAKILDKIW
ncbi:hypothetical protein ABE61_09120 [Lysinibacillus sphaericus]|uniref:hypothetical protein n=1 Tax=Lysinibacillus sphaericus TaxID=1421 RepID=UPI0018CFC7FA|nr:hypothetical protein [Lysinibacillus sphaericus]MBG9454215.1 hypothetical protein [Lysinibacillus sphaericus]MBG9477188.1 hypothetical protein [Lysinibacillus sphaericus]MBG9593807.1 hypothetical protein [Lysinibacillus sphaericus]